MKAFPVVDCDSCHKPIIWAVTERGKRAPYDAQPSPDGTALLTWSAGETTVHSRILRLRERENRQDLRLSHFATCPDAQNWRKRPDPSTKLIPRPANMAGQDLLWSATDEW